MGNFVKQVEGEGEIAVVGGGETSTRAQGTQAFASHGFKPALLDPGNQMARGEWTRLP